MNTTLHYIGANGEAIDLINNPYFHLTDVDGMTEAATDIASSTNSNVDGDRINNMRTRPRSLILDFTIRHCANVEEAKRYILRAIKPKQTGRLRLHKNERDLEIVGTVESISMPRFNNRKGIIMQVTLHCSAPYWQDVENVLFEISRVIDMHYFPLDVGGLAFPVEGVVMGEYDMNMTRTYTNDGDDDCGMIITIVAVGDVANPTIYKSDGSYIGVNTSMIAGDEIIINTNRGAKSITKNGVNILSKIKRGSSFIQLDTGDNELTIKSDSNTEGSVYFLLSFKRRFV